MLTEIQSANKLWIHSKIERARLKKLCPFLTHFSQIIQFHRYFSFFCYNFFIVNKKVITGSRYRSLGRRSISDDLPNYVKDFGEIVANIWSPEIVFVIDVAQIDDELKVIEINGFNSSGFYDSNIKTIIESVSNAVSNPI